jgi:hypothetical protein
VSADGISVSDDEDDNVDNYDLRDSFVDVNDYSYDGKFIQLNSKKPF